jgi:hypothetical protein
VLQEIPMSYILLCSCWLGWSNLLNFESLLHRCSFAHFGHQIVYNIATWRLQSGFHVLKEILMSCIVVGFIQSVGIRVVSIAANIFSLLIFGSSYLSPNRWELCDRAASHQVL